MQSLHQEVCWWIERLQVGSFEFKTCKLEQIERGSFQENLHRMSFVNQFETFESEPENPSCSPRSTGSSRNSPLNFQTTRELLSDVKQIRLQIMQI